MTGLLLASMMAVVGVSPAAATPFRPHVQVRVAEHSTKNNEQPDQLCRRANAARKKVIKHFTKLYVQQFGKKKGSQKARDLPGRDICKHGLRGGKKPPKPRKARYLQTLQRMIAPPRPVVATAAPAPTPTSTAGAASSPSVSSAGAGGLPGCASESGTNYSIGPDNTNPSTGATGRYQEMPMHRAKGGICEGIDLSPAGQDKCAVLIYQAQGASAWVGCGG